MKIDVAIPISVSMRIRTVQLDPEGNIVFERPFSKNLVLDSGLNGMALDTSLSNNGDPAASFRYCHIGSGTNPTSIASGSITFTQAATSLASSSPFFTSAMVGGLFKYGVGSGGVELYITAFITNILVTVGTSMTVASPTVGTVWQVQATTLQTEISRTNTYRTLGGDNFTTCTSPTAVMQRTFNFGTQGSSINVNEIGWGSLNGTSIGGRIVLPSTDVVGIGNTYLVILQLTITFSPASPAAVTNVGTNIDTSGNAMMEFFDIDRVDNTGAITVQGSIAAGANVCAIVMTGVTYTQRTTIANTSTLDWSANETVISGGSAIGWAYAGSRGLCTITGTASISIVTGGQSTFGIGIANFSSLRPSFDIKLTTPYSLLVGVFTPTTVFACLYNRTLVN